MIQDFHIIHIDTLSSLTSRTYVDIQHKLLSDQYLPFLEEKRNVEERVGEIPFASWSDLELIYFYVHRPTHDNEKYERTNETKKEYIRDLLQFYFFLTHALAEETNEELQSYFILSSIEGRHVRAYQKWLKEQPRPGNRNAVGYATATRAKRITLVKSFLAWLYQCRRISFPLQAEFLKTTVRKEDMPDRRLSWEQVKSLLSFYRNQPIPFGLLMVLVTTGLRIQEVANAKWSSVTYDERLNVHFIAIIGKNKKEREVALIPPAMDAIKEYRLRRRVSSELNPLDESPLLPSSRGKSFNAKYLGRTVTKLIHATGLEWVQAFERNNQVITPHYLRHFYAGFSVDQGVDLTAIQDSLRHSSIQTTERYIKRISQKEKEAALKWEWSKFDFFK